MKPEHSPIILPALRGVMGTWIYYACLMRISEIARRVDYAAHVHEIRENKQLSDMIQRKLKGKRAKEIAGYLTTQRDRFFNSLVVATYGGKPNWHALSRVDKEKRKDLAALNEQQIESVGFLTLQGDEKLFALDGQHRLAGIQKVSEDTGEMQLGDDDSALNDTVSVIFVAHKKTEDGLKKTRRLFTTLNKTAKPVSKGEIIALDEDDAMAIITRRLVEKFDVLKEERVAFVQGNNIPKNNKVCLTTIGNLYDVLSILFAEVINAPKKTELKKLKQSRPTEEKLDEYFALATKYFILLGRHFKEVGEFFAASNTQPVVEKYRGNRYGSAIFRPIGLKIFTQAVARLTMNMDLEKAVKLMAKLPRKLNEPPYEGLMWNSKTQTISTRHNVMVREILLYMLNAPIKFRQGEKGLHKRYRDAKGDEKAELPKKLV